MFDKIIDSLYTQGGLIASVKTLCSYVERDMESMCEALDISPFRRKCAKEHTNMLYMIIEKTEEIEKINNEILDKLEKLPDEKET